MFLFMLGGWISGNLCESVCLDETVSDSIVFLIMTLVGFNVATAVVLRITINWDKTPFSPLKVNRYFGETCRLHLLYLLPVSRWFLFGLFFDPEDEGDMFLRNVDSLSTKIEFVVTTDVRTSNQF
jgi:hypothetical protein